MSTASPSEGAPTAIWPPLPAAAWEETRRTLHMWMQIVGKVKLGLAPFWNEWWHTTLQLTARGVSTGRMPLPGGACQIDCDFVDHELRILTSTGAARQLRLEPRSVADFYQELMARLRELGIEVTIHAVPDEVEERIPFADDHEHASYDGEFVRRWWQAMLQSATVLETFRSTFVGKSSPVHLFWGALDLSLTLFSGRPAPQPAGVDRMRALAEDQENFAAGFWPGAAGVSEAAYYCYAYPEPAGIRGAAIQPHQAHFNTTMGEFLLLYDDVRAAVDPEAMILSFLRSTYEATATLANWDRERLERHGLPS